MTPLDVQNLFDFEAIMEAAIAAVLTEKGLTVATPASISEFQSERPRAEIVFKVNGAQHKGSSGHRRIIIQGLPIAITDAYQGQCAITILTNSTEADKATHAQYRAMIRFVMAFLPWLVNGKLLFSHAVQFVKEDSTSLVFEPEKGFWQSSISFSIDFSIQDNAWSAITI